MRVEHFSVDGVFETTEFEPTSGFEELAYDFHVAEGTRSLFLSTTSTDPGENGEPAATRVDLGRIRPDGEFESLDYADADQDLFAFSPSGSITHYAEIGPATGSLVLRIQHEGPPSSMISLTQVKSGSGKGILDRLKGITKCRACIAVLTSIIRFLIAKLTGGIGNLIDIDLPSIEIPDEIIEKLSTVFGIDPKTLKRILAWLRRFLPSPIKDLAKRICERLGIC